MYYSNSVCGSSSVTGQVRAPKNVLVTHILWYWVVLKYYHNTEEGMQCCPHEAYLLLFKRQTRNITMDNLK